MPHHNAHSPLVEVQVHNAATGSIELNISCDGKTGHQRFLQEKISNSLGHGSVDAAIRDLPHLDCAVLRDLRSKVELANVMEYEGEWPDFRQALRSKVVANVVEMREKY